LLPPLGSTRMLQRGCGKQSARQVTGRVLRATKVARLGL
jgi:enoyl-CoA hydratase/carnithine racemase